MRRFFLTPCLLLLFFNLNAQFISYTSIPKDWQVFQRNPTTNVATIPISGQVNISSGYSIVQIRLSNETTSFPAQSFPLTYNNAIATFSFSIDIPALCNNHKIEVWAFKTATNQWLLNKTIIKVLAGDIFIINGQSNAQAYSSPHIEDIDEYTRGWHPDYAWGKLNLSFPGQWGARLANRIADDIHIPVAIFNGAVGALTIDTYLKDTINPVIGNYGALLKRFDDAGLPRKARAVFWFHGEANAWSNESASYVQYFKQLLTNWQTDYSIEQAFVFQMRYGSCTSPRPFIAEAHRLIGQLPGVEVMSTTNAAHDMCHFYYENGYKTLGDRMFDLVANRFYGRNVSNVEAPDVQKAFVSGTKEITIQIKNTAQLQVIGSPWADFRTEGANINIVNGAVSGSNIVLTFADSIANVTGISYLGHAGSNPHWIVNPRSVGLLAFVNTPIVANGGNGNPYKVDLELSVTAPNAAPAAFTLFSTTFTLQNKSNTEATNVKVSIPIPAGIVYEGGNESTTTKGTFDFHTGIWSAGSLAANAVATLKINYFSLNALEKTVFGQISGCDQTDVDSAPNNSTNQSANEDDEAKIVLNQSTAALKPDLELSLQSNTTLSRQWTENQFTLTLQNNGNAAATGVIVDFMNLSLDSLADKFAYVSHAAPAATSFDNWNGKWKIDNIAPGGQVVLVYSAFQKAPGTILIFAQVSVQANPEDDSAAGNNTNGTPTEDDETLVTLAPNNLLISNDRFELKTLDASKIADFAVFPNPTGEKITFDVEKWLGKDIFISAYNHLGTVVFEKNHPALQSPFLTLDLSEWSNGHYMFLLKTNGQRPVSKKVTVTRMY